MKKKLLSLTVNNFTHFENLYFLKIVGPNFVVIRGHNYDKGQIPSKDKILLTKFKSGKIVIKHFPSILIL